MSFNAINKSNELVIRFEGYDIHDLNGRKCILFQSSLTKEWVVLDWYYGAVISVNDNRSLAFGEAIKLYSNPHMVECGIQDIEDQYIKSGIKLPVNE